MKINLPVSQTEHFLQPGKPIVSKTDLKGRITYVNSSFTDISGFHRDELLGASHNIVRHPDMPPEAFADLWRVIKTGQPWRGVVKNRCKNGDFYWVEAYVTPITENGTITGYMSVRTPPKREDVQACEALYRAVREKQSTLPATPLITHGRTRVFLLAQAVSAGLCFIASPFLPDTWQWPVSALGLTSVVIGSWMIHHRLFQPIRATRQALQRITEGQLTERVDPALYNRLSGLALDIESLRINLRATFSDVVLCAQRVESEADGIHAEMQRLTKGSQWQSQRVGQVSAAIEELSTAVDDISRNTQQARQLADETNVAVRQGKHCMSECLDSAGQIQQVVDTMRERITSLAGSISKIAQVSDNIKAIADQTNLLALNASIEAARAGEAGRGFAVVADEVRDLAARTALSTNDITHIVNSIEHETKLALSAMDEASVCVKSDAQKVQSSSDSLDQIDAANQRAVSRIHEIGERVLQQAAVSHEVADNMSNLNATIEEGTQSLRRVGDAVASLENAAHDLHRLVQHLERNLR